MRRSSAILCPAALALLIAYPWPGNVRELLNILERALLLTDNEILDIEHVSSEATAFARSGSDEEPRGETEILPLEEIERRYLARVTAEHAGDRDALAQALGISRRTLFRKLGKL